jgi:hypothetical protein
LGLLAAFALGRLVAGLLFGVTPYDGPTYLWVLLISIGVTPLSFGSRPLTGRERPLVG